jgi:hypothetical protein
MKLKHSHLVVVGRIPDEENVFEVFTNLTAEQAVKAFEKKLVAERIDAHVRNIVLAEVKGHPSIGKTLK